MITGSVDSKVNRIFIVVCLFMTGFTGLVAEMCWIKKGILIFGSTVYSMSVITSVFFFGLAVGNIIFGKSSVTIARPLLWYGLCELCVGVLIFMSPFLFDLIEKVYIILNLNFFGENRQSLLIIIKIFLVSVIVLPPAVLMGASLPLFNKFFIRGFHSITPSIGLLYAVNTFGGASGVFFSGLLFIPFLGLKQTLMYTGSINIATVILFIFSMRQYLLKSAVMEESSEGPYSIDNQLTKSQLIFMGILFFFAGAASMGNELIWVRYLGLVINNTVYTYTIVLGIILFGIMLGSMLTGFLSSLFTGMTIRVYAMANLICGFLGVLLLWIAPDFWYKISTKEKVSTLFVITLLVMFFPSLVTGISFPLGLRIMVKKIRNASRTIGIMTAVNMFGVIFGSLTTGFVILPLLGLKITIVINTFTYIVIACCTLIFLYSSPKKTLSFIQAGIIILSWIFITCLAPVKIPQSFLSGNGQLVMYKETVTSIISVIRNKYDMLIMEIDRLWQGTDQKTHQVMAAHIPCMLHPNPQTVAVVGMGVGQTAKSFLLYPIHQIDCIDIEKAVFPIIKNHFNGVWLDDKRIKKIVDDGRDYFKKTSKKYDILSIEIGQLFRAQCAPFYSVEFYQSVKNNLNTNAYVSQFVPLNFLEKTLFLRIVKTFIKVFPQSTLWYNSHEFLLIGTAGNSVKLDPERVTALLKKKEISGDCSFSIWGGNQYAYNRLENIAASFICGPITLDTMTHSYTVFVDDRPELEYAAAYQKYQMKELNSIIDFLMLRCDPVISVLKKSLSDSLVNQSEFTRKHNLLNIKAVSFMQKYLQTGEEEDLKSAFMLNPLNLDIIMNTALFASQNNDIDGAFQLYYRILSIDSTYSPAYNNLGALVEQKGNYVEATRLYGLAVKHDSLNVQAYKNICRIYYKRFKPDSAKTYIRRALELNPHNRDLKKMLMEFDSNLEGD